MKNKKNKIRKFKISSVAFWRNSLFFSFFLSLFPSFCLAATTFKYKLMEGIPGFSEAGAGSEIAFPAYISAIYKFGLWAIGLCAMFMIMLGGYMYLTSAGNTSQTGKAKGIIFDALAGLALALVSWLLLYTINPELVNFTSIVKP